MAEAEREEQVCPYRIRILPRVTVAIIATIAIVEGTKADVEFRLVAARSSYTLRPGVTLRVPVFLEERLTGSSLSILAQQSGVFSVGVSTTRLSPVPVDPCFVRAEPPASPNTSLFFGVNEGPFAAFINVQGAGTSATMVEFSRAAGVTGELLNPTTRRIRLGEIWYVGGEPQQAVTTFLLHDPIGTTDTITWNGGLILDSQIGSTTVTIQVLPECDDIDFNNDNSIFDPQDIEAFLSVYSEGPCVPLTASCNDIDFNNDGSLFDPQDIESFLNVYSEGPCI